MFSIIAGILAGVLPNLIFVWVCFRSGTSNIAPKNIVRGFYLAEVLKFVVLVLLLSVLLQLSSLNVPRFFLAFLLSEMARLFYHFFILARATL